MPCDSPFYVLPYKGAFEKVPVPCGKCPPCKLRRVNQWTFRLMQEEKRSTSGYFVTLTYDTRYVPISPNGFLTLRKKDFQDYMKRLRKLCPDFKLKYYAAGEYGSKNHRPHFHAIVFNVPDPKMFFSAWSDNGQNMGSVQVGKVSSNSIAYTAKYIDKPNFKKRHERDDREPEFSLMSKGLGSNYMTPQVINYHKSNLGNVFVTKSGGHKVSMPRYYRKKMFTEHELKSQRYIIESEAEKAEILARINWEQQHLPGETYERYKDNQRLGRYNKFYNNESERRKI